MGARIRQLIDRVIKALTPTPLVPVTAPSGPRRPRG
jgi:hypothetical protein